MFEIKTGVWTFQPRVNDGGGWARKKEPTTENSHPNPD